MIIAVEDKSYRCKNCDSFGQCEYYYHRRPDSHICKEFSNDWRQRDVLDKISAEIEEIKYPEGRKSCLDAEYFVNEGLDRALDIIKKYKEDSE